MKKIFMSILAIALTVGAVSGTAYALFSDTVQVQGITMTSGNADLKILQMDGSTFDNSLTVSQGLGGSDLYPGHTFTMPWTLKNVSNSPIALTVFNKMNSVSDKSGYGGSWNLLKNAIQMRVYKSGIVDTGYHTLSDWYSTGYSLGTVAHDATVDYTVYFKIDSSVDSTVANKAIENVGFLLTATQQ